MESFQLLRIGRTPFIAMFVNQLEAGVPDIWSTCVQKADLDTPSRKQPTKGCEK
jgi:hypothetical protein